jgi:uncharacterized protein
MSGDPSLPFAVDGRGRTSVAPYDRHVADLVEAVLFTAPGERVNRPDFGCGLDRLVFAPVDVTVVGTAELQVRSGLQRWLGDVIEVDDVAVELEDSTVRVGVRYRLRANGRVETVGFERSAG